MQIQQLRYIKKTAETKNISAAAKELFISQPSLSQQIIKLEKELGVPLFIRHSKCVALTPAGEEFVIYATRILNDLDTLTSNMKLYSTLKRGSLKIGLLPIGGYLGLSNYINDFQKINTDLDISLKVDLSNVLLDKVITREIDVAFIIGSENLNRNNDIFCKKIMEDNYVAVVSRQNPLSSKNKISASDLIGQPVILPSKDSSARKVIDSMFSSQHVIPNIIAEISQSDIIMQLVSQNLAIGFFSVSIASMLHTEELVTIPLTQTITRPIYYITLSDLLTYPTVKSFTEYILQK